jgi:hypothetical protein
MRMREALDQIVEEHRKLDVDECDWRQEGAPCDIHDEEENR